MAQFSISDAVLPTDWLLRYKVPLSKETTRTSAPVNDEPSVDGIGSGSAWTKACLLDIVERPCPVRSKDFYVWTWRAAGDRNSGGKDAEGNVYVWRCVTDAVYRQGSTLKPFLDKLTETKYSLSAWKALGLAPLIGRVYWVSVERGIYVTIPEQPVNLLCDSPRLAEHGCHVASATMLDKDALLLAEWMASACNPLPVPQIVEVTMNLSDIPDVPCLPVPARAAAVNGSKLLVNTTEHNKEAN